MAKEHLYSDAMSRLVYGVAGLVVGAAMGWGGWLFLLDDLLPVWIIMIGSAVIVGVLSAIYGERFWSWLSELPWWWW